MTLTFFIRVIDASALLEVVNEVSRLKVTTKLPQNNNIPVVEAFMMLFDLSPTIQNTMNDSSVKSVAPYQSNTNMPSLIPEDDSNNSSPMPSGALPRTSSKRKMSSMRSSRSSNIPLPSSHVARTQSEVQLCLDEEAAEQRDANMFYRLVNGIRKRQSSPTRDVDVISSERSIAGIYHSRLASHVEVTEHKYSFDLAETPMWQMLESTRARVSESEGSSNDEWSLSGFDSYQHEQPNASATITLHDEEDDEGVFSLDL
jgi:hypothetical protein